MPQSMGAQIFFWTAIGFIILYFVVMIVDFIAWLIKGRPLTDKPFVTKTKPANDNNTAPKIVQ